MKTLTHSLLSSHRKVTRRPCKLATRAQFVKHSRGHAAVARNPGVYFA
jgi:hypothetical protein